MWQCCPICRREVTYNKRFPYYLCTIGTSLLTDRKGRSVVFSFASNPFGFKGFYKNNPGAEYLYNVCYIGNEEFRVYSDGKYSCFIQPTDFLKYANRPQNLSEAPQDPENLPQRKKTSDFIRSTQVTFFDLLKAISPLLYGFTLSFFIETKTVQFYPGIFIFLFISLFVFLLIFYRKIYLRPIGLRSIRNLSADVFLFLFSALIGILIIFL
mgnify:CR=1 FL=1